MATRPRRRGGARQALRQGGSIVVAGDVSIDWLDWPLPPRDDWDSEGQPPLNWQLWGGSRLRATPGGALLLARFLRKASQREVATHALLDPHMTPPEQVVYSLLQLQPDSPDERRNKPAIFRVKAFHGYCGPAEGAPPPLPIHKDDRHAEMVVLDDTGNGFRDRQDLWPIALKRTRNPPLVVYKTHLPLAEGELWHEVLSRHAERLVVIVTADDLRAAGLKFSHCLSWERTAMELALAMASIAQPPIRSLADCKHLLIRIGLDGVIHYRASLDGQPGRLQLYFDPASTEGAFAGKSQGKMIGYGSAFAAAVAARLLADGGELTPQAVISGFEASRRLLDAGFVESADGLDYNDGQIFEVGSLERSLGVLDVPSVTEGFEAYAAQISDWSALKRNRQVPLELVASDYVRTGKSDYLKAVPVGAFGDFVTYDRAEIESFQSIKNLLQGYLQTEGKAPPLSIAVFGPPGSGKSFGVKQIARSIARDRVVSQTWNLSQFASPDQLRIPWHWVRDVNLTGKLPLVFFDEFDARLGDQHLGWLKYFLAPMQDGEFQDGDAVHPLGKAILVFAGGTAATFAQFYPEPQSADAYRQFSGAKGPDFVSRLRGYVNVLGPNQSDENDVFFVIRRAMLLRGFLMRSCPELFTQGKRFLRIDDAVLRALINVPCYRHGVRSMQAIAEMSSTKGIRRLTPAALPPASQLDLHVDAEEFLRLLNEESMFGIQRERLAEAFHQQYRRDQAGRKTREDPSMQPWETLRKDLKDQNRQVADDVPRKLRLIGCSMRAVHSGRITPLTFKRNELEILAREEHERWRISKERQGWKHGPTRDEANKLHPHLVPWDNLAPGIQDYDREQVQAIPQILAGAGFKIERSAGER